MKAPIKNYLSITKKEWNGLIVLVIIIALVLAAPYGYQLFHKDNTINFNDFNKAVALLKRAKDTYPSYTNSAQDIADDKIAHPVMVAFNPNHLPDEQWKQLGLSGRQVSIIKHYEAKGGHFYKKEDVQKIYAITADDYKRLEPYISIPGKEYTSNKARPGIIIEINSADSAKLTQIHGIGPAFAMRIIAYRDRLGGFLNKEQLKEVYGIDTVKYAQIKNEISINPAHITKIKINEVDFEALRKFPYLTNKQTNAIIQYHKQHGDYKSITGLKNIAILDENILRKIEPYLVF
ncbi:MAG: Helix-hairpin-helix motif protein [Mucilaginibacter sp.]|nr:Helix-hairpin-helix motif protein [Mucilaginibacter sp.]